MLNHAENAAYCTAQSCSTAAQGTLTYVGPANAVGQVIIVLRIDLGYPVQTLLFSGATLLAIPFDPDTGLLTTNTSDVYLPSPYYYAVDGAG